MFDRRRFGISPDGRHIAFSSRATNMVAEDLNNETDVFVRDLITGDIRIVSVSSAGVQQNDAEPDGGTSQARCPAVAAGGQIIAFLTPASNLADDDTNVLSDLYVRDESDASQGDLNHDGVVDGVDLGILTGPMGHLRQRGPQP